ncbi:MAG: YitT family protein [Cyclobacteriaceae bacterium]
MKKSAFTKFLRESSFILIGILSASFGLNSFLLPNQFIDGGATGIALLIAETTVLDLSYAILLINIPFLILGYIQMSKQFVLKTGGSIIILSLILALVEFPIITKDLLLVSIFGGFFLGAGIGLAIRGGAVIDGMEILALYLTRRINISIGDLILISNVIIFGASALLLGIESALYSMVAYFVASKTMDFFIQGIEEYLGITIISKKNRVIKERIIKEMKTGVTMLNSNGGFGSTGANLNSSEVLYTVITRLEYLKIQNIINDVDDEAFIVVGGVRDVKGGLLKKRKLPD